MDEMVQRKRRSKTEPVRGALLRFKEEWEWRKLLHYGEQQARSQGIAPGGVESLVDEYRAEAEASEPHRPAQETGTVLKERAR